MTQRLALACARNPWLTVGAWIGAMIVALLLVGTLLSGNLTGEGKVTNNPESLQGFDLQADRFPRQETFDDLVVIGTAGVDPVLGIAWGAVVEKANELPVADQPAASRLIDVLLEPERLGYVLYFGGGLLWLAVALTVVTALWRTARRPALVLMAIGATVFALGHARPVGPIGMTLLLAGIAWLELRPRREEAGHASLQGP